MNRKAFKGFTIIEVLVVIVIIGMVMAVGSVRYREFSKRQMVVSVKRQIVADIRAAQSDAASGIKPGGCNASTYRLVGFAFEITNTGSPTTPASYETYAICNNGSDSEFVTKQADLPLGVTLSITTAPLPVVNPVIFRPLANGTNLSSSAVSTIAIAIGANTDSILISSGGEIR